MGTRARPREEAARLRVRFIRNHGGPVAQLLHPYWVARSDAGQMGSVLAEAESLISEGATETKVVLTGGGFVEFTIGQPQSADWHSEGALRTLLEQVRPRAHILRDALGDTPRCYVVGVDVVHRGRGVGQFAVLLGGGQTGAIVWKSYPRSDEERFVAEFGTRKGLESPRFVETPLGDTVVLVCHDAQVFNHRTRANVRSPTRVRVIGHVQSKIDEHHPSWALNLVHYIEKPGSLNPFYVAYKQMNEDNPWRPRAVGAFGYQRRTHHLLADLARKAQYPPGAARCTLAVELPPGV